MGMKSRADAARKRFCEAMRASNRDMLELYTQRLRLIETFRSSCPHPHIVEEIPDRGEGGDFGPDPCCRLCTRCGLMDATMEGPFWERPADKEFSRSDYKEWARLVYDVLGLADGGR